MSSEAQETVTVSVDSVLSRLQIPKEFQDSTKFAGFRSDIQIAIQHKTRDASIGFDSGKVLYNVHFDHQGNITTEVINKAA